MKGCRGGAFVFLQSHPILRYSKIVHLELPCPSCLHNALGPLTASVLPRGCSTIYGLPSRLFAFVTCSGQYVPPGKKLVIRYVSYVSSQLPRHWVSALPLTPGHWACEFPWPFVEFPITSSLDGLLFQGTLDSLPLLSPMNSLALLFWLPIPPTSSGVPEDLREKWEPSSLPWRQKPSL